MTWAELYYQDPVRMATLFLKNRVSVLDLVALDAESVPTDEEFTLDGVHFFNEEAANVRLAAALAGVTISEQTPIRFQTGNIFLLVHDEENHTFEYENEDNTRGHTVNCSDEQKQVVFLLLERLIARSFRSIFNNKL